jgi:hypothetical protein
MSAKHSEQSGRREFLRKSAISVGTATIGASVLSGTALAADTNIDVFEQNGVETRYAASWYNGDVQGGSSLESRDDINYAANEVTGYVQGGHDYYTVESSARLGYFDVTGKADSDIQIEQNNNLSSSGDRTLKIIAENGADAGYQFGVTGTISGTSYNEFGDTTEVSQAGGDIESGGEDRYTYTGEITYISAYFSAGGDLLFDPV